MKFLPRLLLGLVMAALLLSACAVTARNALIGKWEDATQGAMVEFTMDGHLRQTIQGSTTELGFQFLDDNNITIIVPAATGKPQPIPFQITGDQLTLQVTDQSGQPKSMVLQRIK